MPSLPRTTARRVLLPFLAVLPLLLGGSMTSGVASPSAGTTSLAWFYMRNTDATPVSTLVARHSVMILSGSDYEVGFLQQVRNAGWTQPVLEYIGAPWAMGPSGALNGSCTAGYAGYTTTWTSDVDEFCNQVHPNESWFLHNGAGKRIYRDYGGGSSLYVMNPSSAGWRSYVQAKVGRIFTTYRMDGLFLDDVWATAYRPRSRETNSDGTCRECGTDAQWHAAWAGMLQAIKQAAGSRPVWINSDDSSALVGPVDGHMIENMGASWGSSFMPQSEIEQRWRDIDANVVAGKDVLLVGQGNRTDTQRMRFSHAVYLMVAGPRVSYRFQNADDYRGFWDYPEFSRDLGAALGSRYQVGTSVWRRNFSAGTAVANLSSSTSQTIELGATYTLPTGSQASAVTLGPQRGWHSPLLVPRLLLPRLRLRRRLRPPPPPLRPSSSPPPPPPPRLRLRLRPRRISRSARPASSPRTTTETATCLSCSRQCWAKGARSRACLSMSRLQRASYGWASTQVARGQPT